MNTQNLIVYDSKIIFSILDELNDQLNYKLFYKSKKDFSQLKEKEIQEALILTKENINGVKDQIVLEFLPIRIKNLIETINISFLKKNFNIQSDISIGSYKLNLNSRKIYTNRFSLDLTEKEADVILYLRNSVKPCSIVELQESVWKHASSLETHTVETHVYRLRKKIKKIFNDENFIISSKKGYTIN